MKKEELKKAIEALLFVAAKPLTEKKIASITSGKIPDVHSILEELHKKYKDDESGVRIMKSGTSWQMVTAESVSKIISEYIKDEVSGELTRPSLEALSIIAYRGPLSKAEIEEIRGVNCSIIIRNLLIRGLIEETKQQKKVVPKYNVTVDFLKYLGIERVSELPEFEKLNSHEILEQILKKS